MPRVVVVAVLALASAPLALAEPVADSAGDAVQAEGDAGEAEPSEGMIQLNFPENTPLKVLVDYVAERLDLNLIYDPAILNARVTIKTTTPVSEQALRGLLESVLKMNGLALTDAEQENWKRIVQAQNLVQIADLPDGAQQVGLSVPVTRTFTIDHAELDRIDQVVQPYLSGRGANTVALEQERVLIVTDYAANLPRIERMIDLLDQPRPPVEVVFLEVQHLEAAALAQQANQLLAAQRRSRSPGRDPQLQITPEPRTNQLVLIGPRASIEQARAIVASLDVPLQRTTEMYQLQAAAPERIDRLVQELIGPLAAQTQYASAIDREANLLIVTAPQAVQAQVQSLLDRLDVPPEEGQSPVRFYKLANRTADEVLSVIQAIEGREGLASLQMPADGEPDAGGRGAGRPDAADGEAGEAAAPEREPDDLEGVVHEAERSAAATHYSQRTGPPRGAAAQLRPSVHTPQARITADADTNTIIVVADPAAQPIYERLIRMLDRRRPQVLIEVTLVTLDTSRGHSVGVELSGSEIDNGRRKLIFSSFGLSEVDAQTGRLSLQPGAGLNAALLGADVGDIVIRALRSDANASVVSAPRILVNDNATGTLASVNEAPFTSVNASQTVATTSFAGYASAGTTITVTPHISQDNYLQLGYDVTLNSFTGAGTDTAPPPRQTNTVSSEVTIPDGSMIVVGGLNRRDISESISRIPILGEIPLLEHLASSRTNNNAETTLFVFIRPMILRDDAFEDLKFLSERDLQRADLPGNYPASEPLTVR